MSYDLPPNPITPRDDRGLRRANALIRLDLERQAETSRRRDHPLDDFDRRLERIEASIAVIASRLDDVESLAGLAQEQAESVSGAW